MWYASLAVVTSLAAVLLARGQLVAVRGAPSPAAAELRSALLRAERAERVRVAVRTTNEHTWEGRLARAIAAAADERDRVDAVSERVGDLASRLARHGGWASSAVRVQLSLGLLLGVLPAATGRWVEGAVAFGVSAFAAGVAHGLGRRAAGEEAPQRKLADDLVALLLTDGPGEAAPPLRPGLPPTSLDRVAGDV